MSECRKCKYYAVSWDPQAPHSCRLYQIKSKQMPKIVIKKSTLGGDCMGFEAKADRRKKPGMDLNDPKLW
jgi:hypothetical protein